MNLLITRHDKIGDFVLTLPMIKLAKEQLPDTNITVLVSKANYEFAKNIDFIDEVVLYEKKALPLAKRLRKVRYEMSISAYSDTRLAMALLLAGIKKRVSPATKIAQIFANIRIKQRRSQVKMREFEYNIELLRAVFPQIKPEFSRPVLEFTDDEKKAIYQHFKDEFGINDNERLIVLHPGYGGSSDGNLRLDDYLELGKIVSKTQGTKCVFSFGPDDKKTYEYVSKKISYDAVLFKSKLSLIDYCKLACNFSLFVSTSTGPMHLAAAVNTPTFSFFGNTLFASDKRWGSINENQTNFCIAKKYDRATFEEIKAKFIEAINV
ncbi:MAG: glycosyltransferase family 9 protein [Campylobacter sp.]|nr:glycosyltransferase family 9 protein [Campylobacter sp.]